MQPKLRAHIHTQTDRQTHRQIDRYDWKAFHSTTEQKFVWNMIWARGKNEIRRRPNKILCDDNYKTALAPSIIYATHTWVCMCVCFGFVRSISSRLAGKLLQNMKCFFQPSRAEFEPKMVIKMLAKSVGCSGSTHLPPHALSLALSLPLHSWTCGKTHLEIFKCPRNWIWPALASENQFYAMCFPITFQLRLPTCTHTYIFIVIMFVTIL